eukprot:6601567-Pyramimonas_sp.AAC.1
MHERYPKGVGALTLPLWLAAPGRFPHATSTTLVATTRPPSSDPAYLGVRCSARSRYGCQLPWKKSRLGISTCSPAPATCSLRHRLKGPTVEVLLQYSLAPQSTGEGLTLTDPNASDSLILQYMKQTVPVRVSSIANLTVSRVYYSYYNHSSTLPRGIGWFLLQPRPKVHSILGQVRCKGYQRYFGPRAANFPRTPRRGGGRETPPPLHGGAYSSTGPAGNYGSIFP